MKIKLCVQHINLMSKKKALIVQIKLKVIMIMIIISHNKMYILNLYDIIFYNLMSIYL